MPAELVRGRDERAQDRPPDIRSARIGRVAACARAGDCPSSADCIGSCTRGVSSPLSLRHDRSRCGLARRPPRSNQSPGRARPTPPSRHSSSLRTPSALLRQMYIGQTLTRNANNEQPARPSVGRRRHCVCARL
ncbi:hypothetical protein BC628DRAFT_987790 [Trametes gibbosa]|nr:hypothetical protein BC628DRAFT_987790 [Trametes gibbosa]